MGVDGEGISFHKELGWSLLFLYNCNKIKLTLFSAAYSALLDLLADLRGLTSRKGGEEGKRRGREGPEPLTQIPASAHDS